LLVVINSIVAVVVVGGGSVVVVIVGGGGSGLFKERLRTQADLVDKVGGKRADVDHGRASRLHAPHKLASTPLDMVLNPHACLGERQHKRCRVEVECSVPLWLARDKGLSQLLGKVVVVVFSRLAGIASFSSSPLVDLLLLLCSVRSGLLGNLVPLS
jgi:hypothetical protein